MIKEAELGGEACWWWLRSPGNVVGNAADVSYAGFVNVNGNNVYNDSGGVRPALWVKLG
jgi:hypothetical protein